MVELGTIDCILVARFNNSEDRSEFFRLGIDRANLTLRQIRSNAVLKQWVVHRLSVVIMLYIHPSSLNDINPLCN